MKSFRAIGCKFFEPSSITIELLRRTSFAAFSLRYGDGTASAVSSFRQAAGLAGTGRADRETQAALYSDDAPKSKAYAPLEYKAIARDPDARKGERIAFKGKVLQGMEGGDIVVFGIACFDLSLI